MGIVNLTKRGWRYGVVTIRDPLYRRHRFPAEVIAHAVWLYFRFPLSLRMVEDMLAARGIIVSHQPIRRRELIMKRFKSQRHLQRFVSIHDPIANLFHIQLHDISSSHYRELRAEAMTLWAKIARALTVKVTAGMIAARHR